MDRRREKEAAVLLVPSKDLKLCVALLLLVRKRAAH